MGNCFDRTLTDSDAEDDHEAIHDEDEDQPNNRSSRSRGGRSSRNGAYSRMLDRTSSASSSSLSSVGSIRHQMRSSHHQQHVNPAFSAALPISSSHHNHTHHHHHHHQSSSTTNPLQTSSSPANQVFYLAPNVQRTADQLTEEEQIKLLKRMALIQQLPVGSYDESKKNKE